jgi:hypothetical protein
LNQFTDSGAGSSQKTHHKIPVHFSILLETVFEIKIISLTDDIFQEGLLLYFYSRQLPLFLLNAFQITVYSPNPQVYGLRFVVLNQIDFVITEIFAGEAAVPVVVLIECVHIRDDGVLR